MKLKELKEAVGSLSAPSKMPCSGYSIPAKECNVGSRLVTVKGSTCSDCYALKNRYVFPNVEKAMYHRFDSINTDVELWTKNMITYISKYRKGDKSYFRWHDSGDIIDTKHLSAMVEIAIAIPECNFWLPTREIKTVRIWQKMYGEFPKNLTVRISAMMNDAQPNHKITGYASGVEDEGSLNGYKCPAPKQENNCLDCRACWTAETVIYHKH
jgi:hypothetical protein